MTSDVRRRLLSIAASGAVVGALGLAGGARRGVAQTLVSDGSRDRGAGVLRGDPILLNVAGNNVVALPAPGGAVLVDGADSDSAGELVERIAKLPGGTGVRTLFNTCWHPAQTGANAELGRAGAAIIAHENTRLWMTAEVTWPWDGRRFDPVDADALPTDTFYDTGALDVGGRTIEYGHIRACPHTDGDIYVFFRDANVLAVGNAVSGNGWPAIDWRTGGWLGGVVGAMELLLVLADDDTQIVPARGRVLRRADIEAQHAMYDLLYERFVNLLYEGKSTEEAVAARPTAEFDAELGPSDAFVSRAFQSLWGYLTPDA